MSSKTSKCLRWGIASAGKISNDFCIALTTLPSDEHQTVAIAARQLERAQEFAKKFNIPNAFDSYEQLAKCPDIDIVYIGTLNPQHYEVSRLMLEHGKHVLCEKPLCMNEKEAKKLIQYAESKRLFLMEAVWSRFFPAYQYVRSQIENARLGTVQSVEVSFGFDIRTSDRVQKKDLGGGVVLDLGIYCIQVAQWAFQEPPQKVVAKGELNAEGVDVKVDAELHYSGGRIARFHIDGTKDCENKAVIKGTNGEIAILKFWCPTKIVDIDGTVKEWALPITNIPSVYYNAEGMRYEAEAARQSIFSGELENQNVKHNDSLLFAQLEDEIRKQIGVSYETNIRN